MRRQRQRLSFDPRTAGRMVDCVSVEGTHSLSDVASEDEKGRGERRENERMKRERRCNGSRVGMTQTGREESNCGEKGTVDGGTASFFSSLSLRETSSLSIVSHAALFQAVAESSWQACVTVARRLIPYRRAFETSIIACSVSLQRRKRSAASERRVASECGIRKSPVRRAKLELGLKRARSGLSACGGVKDSEVVQIGMIGIEGDSREMIAMSC